MEELHLFDEVEKRKQIGERLKEAIKKSPYTQEEFAAACGISYNSLRTYIKGNSYYRADLLLKVSKLSGMSIEYLLCEEKNSILPQTFFADRTHLSPKAVETLFNLGLHYNTIYNSASNRITALNEIIINDALFEKLSNYMLVCRLNKNGFRNSNLPHQAWYFERIDKQFYQKFGTSSLIRIIMHELMTELDKLGEKRRKR